MTAHVEDLDDDNSFSAGDDLGEIDWDKVTELQRLMDDVGDDKEKALALYRELNSDG